MRRLVMTLLLIFGLCLVPILTNAAAQVRVQVNGRLLTADTDPVLERGRVLIPLRVVMEELGADVRFQETTKTVTVSKGETEIVLIIGDPTAAVNDSSVEMDVPAAVFNGRTLVPLRFISQSLGADVQWQEEQKLVIIDASVQADPADVGAEIFRLVNKSRQAQGLVSLVWMDELTELARRHSQDMAENEYFSHTSPQSGDPTKRAKAAGLPATSENIAAGYGDAAGIFQAWMDSPSHRANILNPENRFIGVGFFREKDPDDPYSGVYCTQEFIQGDAFFLSPFSEVSISSRDLSVSGVTVNEEVEVTVYKLVDRNTYSDQYKEIIKSDHGRFQGEIRLKEGKGLYALRISNGDVRYVTYK